ncbi:MAG TPA: hypothetical protein VNO43_12590 [Candidatus Eisenbacteria bacterium]|nr:hypothetical protein [Candidatus Eisenbacteria bacterium]
MTGLPPKPNTRGTQRTLSLILLLAVFFLPLHFHALTVASQVNKECSCLSGSRTQPGLAIEPARWLPLFDAYAIAPEVQVWPEIAVGRARHIRAPPALASL